MWLRHALKFFLPTILFSACSSPDRQVVDKLNSLSYAYHYRNLDSTVYYARQAYDLSQQKADGTFLSQHYIDGQAEALNNLAFVSISRMRYEQAQRQLDSIPQLTSNQIELLISYIQQMRLCQRRSFNREFYDYKIRAQEALSRINEERALLDERSLQRLRYAETELAIVTSTYFYYIGLSDQSVEALEGVGEMAQGDTCQLLNYYYNVGAGGVIVQGTQKEINQQEFDHLMRCFLLAQKGGYPYFMANALEAIAEHFINPIHREQLMTDNMPAMKFINTTDALPEELPEQLAEEALCLFQAYGDVYQIAGAYRTLASCSRARGLYASALFYLEHALSDTLINQAPDLVASIREQLSVAYAAVDDKPMSDQNRNVYLDLQEQTRQDRWLEARAGQLDDIVSRLNMLLWALVAVIVLFVFQLFIINHYYRRKRHLKTDERMEELEEQIAVAQLHLRESERTFLEQRAKVSLANNITPFVDRMLYEANKLSKAAGAERLDYIRELTDGIRAHNDLLTQWIQLRQGLLKLHIETFALQSLFDMLAKGQKSFEMRGVTLDVEPTALTVKADRILTLFMLNTLADNSRKFTPEGGRVEVKALEGDDYVEIAVSDSGCGMSEEQLAHVFDRKPIKGDSSFWNDVQTSHGDSSPRNDMQTSHGFGLQNCRGIIEKYRKTSRIFSVCQLTAESKQGRGSRFAFRLPKGVVRLLLCLACLASTATMQAQQRELALASAYADSAFYSNVNGNYGRTILFADICRQALNDYYRKVLADSSFTRACSADTLLFMGDLSNTQAEIRWLHDSIPLNYQILLTMRNETAVAALALHQWELYRYNNRVYTQLFKELSADNRLDDYCRKMQQSQNNLTVAIVLLVVFLVVLIAGFVFQLTQMMKRNARRQKQQEDSISMKEDELHKTALEEARLHVSNQVLDNCLSALKHETMYYPSRIRQLVDTNDFLSLPEVVGYYRDLYALLTQQAMLQTDHLQLHLKRLDHDILGDENLISYLFELLRKQTKQKTLDVGYETYNDQYVRCKVRMPQLTLTAEQARQLFDTQGDASDYDRKISFLLCRQIVRDHGEATSHRGCGIWAEVEDNQTIIIILLPKQICRTSK